MEDFDVGVDIRFTLKSFAGEVSLPQIHPPGWAYGFVVPINDVSRVKLFLPYLLGDVGKDIGQKLHHRQAIMAGMDFQRAKIVPGMLAGKGVGDVNEFFPVFG